jgi:hypothetical protein
VTRAVATVVLLAGCTGAAPAPVPIVWDEQPCDECHMHVGDPRFAAELDDGEEIRIFDDPGCLFRYVAERRPHVVAAWFHDSARDRWLPWDDARFIAGAETPMGYGLAAVGTGTPGSFDRLEAARRVAIGASSAGGRDAHP